MKSACRSKSFSSPWGKNSLSADFFFLVNRLNCLKSCKQSFPPCPACPSHRLLLVQSFSTQEEGFCNNQLVARRKVHSGTVLSGLQGFTV